MPTLPTNSQQTITKTIYVTTTKVIDKTNLGIVVAIFFGLFVGLGLIGGGIYSILNRTRQRKSDRIAKEIINPVHDDTPL